ncbi:AraC family ligand binding domain-containing protein [Vibrio ostreicida]|uniref:AraC family transcriptional regulator n=1 Tax=Vibrio ostreicida TaxID=526588 RepID=UPI000970D7CB|nr:AraC family transcriptional regulator [Vibrio ostreicida]
MEQVHYHTTQHTQLSLIEANYQSFSFTRHYHLDFHIGLITEGEQKFQYQGTHYHVGAGQLVIMPPDELHDGQSLCQSGYQVRVFTLEPCWFSELAQLQRPQTQIHFKQLVISDDKLFTSLAKLHGLLANSKVSQLAQDCMPYEGFERLFRHYGSVKQTHVTPLGNQSIATLKDYLLDHLDQPIRLQDLSQLCQLSPTQFQRHFKAKIGITPYAWLTRLRLEQAMKLLRAGGHSIDVAYQIGFYDQAHFIKAFKTTFGVTPSQIN